MHAVTDRFGFREGSLADTAPVKRWSRCAIRAITKVRVQRNRQDLPLLSVYRDRGVVLRTDEDANHNVIPVDLSGYKVVRKGDLVLNKMKTWQGSLGVSEQDGIVSPAYIVCQLIGELSPRYIHYLLRSSDYIAIYNRLSYGVRVDQWDMRYADFKNIPICLPTRPEQDAIVAFLDRKLTDIDRFIAAKKRMIELLEEQQAAMIDRAVTKGLNPNAKMKPSGLEWLGEIPAHWRRTKLARICSSIRDGTHNPPPEAKDGPCRLLSVRNIVDGEFVLRDDDRRMTRNDYELLCRSYTVQKGDVVLALVGGTTGKSAVVGDVTDVSVQRSIGILRPRRQMVLPAFLCMALRSRLVQRRIWDIADKYAAQPGIYLEDVGKLQIALPLPGEQEQLHEDLRTAFRPVETARARVEREIELMTEYRVALISDAVTGKINLSAVAPVTSAAAQANASVEPAKTGRSANIHFKRSVFAAEIIHRLHQEPTFGHVKFEKLMFLCEKRCRVETGSTYRRKAAGPYDNRALRSIDSQIQRRQWYGAEEIDKRYRYVPLQKAGGQEPYFRRYFADVEAEFSRVVNTFRNWDTERCEIVATLYSAWEDLLADGKAATDNQILEQVLEHWHPAKQRIPEDRWRKAIGWMKEQGLVPRTVPDR